MCRCETDQVQDDQKAQAPLSQATEEKDKDKPTTAAMQAAQSAPPEAASGVAIPEGGGDQPVSSDGLGKNLGADGEEDDEDAPNLHEQESIEGCEDDQVDQEEGENQEEPGGEKVG